MIFQQNTATIRNTKKTRKWFQQKKLPLVKWPSRSPDLNPIEKLWEVLSRAVYKNGKQYNNIEELENVIKYKWGKN